MGKEKWISTSYWDACSHADEAEVMCFHVHEDRSEHPCDISPLTAVCARTLLSGKCGPGTIVRCQACDMLMLREDEITYRP